MTTAPVRRAPGGAPRGCLELRHRLDEGKPCPDGARLARLLLLLANFGKEGRPEPIIAKISQEVLAEMIGATRSRVSHLFRELGFIDYNGHLEVHSSLLSVVLNEQGRTVAPTA
jgi:Crp-like helix-turn-helix domain